MGWLYMCLLFRAPVFKYFKIVRPEPPNGRPLFTIRIIYAIADHEILLAFPIFEFFSIYFSHDISSHESLTSLKFSLFYLIQLIFFILLY